MSKAQRSVRHHYVPSTLGRRFSDESGKFYYKTRSSRHHPFGKSEYRRPERAFYEKDLYTMYDNEGIPHDRIEREFFGPLDDFFGEFLKKVDEVFAEGSNPTLSKETRLGLSQLVTSNFARNPQFGVGPEALREVRENFPSILAQTSEEFGDDPLTVLAQFEDESLSDQEIQNILMKAITKKMPNSEKFLNQLETAWVVIEGKSRFILGDRIAYHPRNALSKLFSSAFVGLVMPLHPKRAIAFVGQSARKLDRISVGDASVRKLNEIAVSESLCIASASNPQLESLTRRYRPTAE